MSDDEATFYTQLAYQGDPHAYKLGTDETLWPGHLNDQFLSVRVGAMVKVLAWQDDGGGGSYGEWDVDQPDITSIGGLSRFQVAELGTLPIAVRLEDATGAAPGSYSLTAESYQVGRITVPSGDPDFGLIGIMPVDGPPVTTAIYVRDEQPGHGQYVATGAIYFVWNGATGTIDVADQTNFPANMDCQRADRNKFTLRLISV